MSFEMIPALAMVLLGLGLAVPPDCQSPQNSQPLQAWALLVGARILGAVVGLIVGWMVLLPAIGLKLTGILAGAVCIGIGLLWGRHTKPAGPARRVAQPAPLKAAATLGTTAAALLIGYAILLPASWGNGPTVPTTKSIDAKLLAHMPSMLHGSPRRSLYIGLGGRHALDSLYAYASYKSIASAKPWASESSDDSVAAMVLNTCDEPYDVILCDQLPWQRFASVPLTCREFFALCKKRLAPSGQLGIALGRDLSARDLRSVIATVAAEFDFLHLWEGSPGSYLLFASTQPARVAGESLADRVAVPAVKADLQRVGLSSIEDLFSRLLAGNDALRRWATDAPQVTRDNMRLFFSCRSTADDKDASVLESDIAQLASANDVRSLLDDGTPVEMLDRIAAARREAQTIRRIHRQAQDQRDSGNLFAAVATLAECARRQPSDHAVFFDLLRTEHDAVQSAISAGNQQQAKRIMELTENLAPPAEFGAIPDEAGTLANITANFADLSKAAMFDKNVEMAAGLARRATRGNSSNRLYRRMLADALIRLGKPDDAVAALRTTDQTISAGDDALLKGIALMDAGDLPGAVRAFEKIIAVGNPHSLAVGDAHAQLALIDDKNENYADALKHYLGALAAKPDSPELHFRAARIYRMQDKVDQAANHLKLAHNLDPKNTRWLRALVTLLLEHNRMDEMADAIETVYRQLPQNPKVRNYYAELCLEQGRVQEAVDVYAETLALAPDNAEALGGLAYILATQDSVRDNPRALDLAKRAQALAPNTYHTYQALIAAHIASGNRTEAAKLAETALRLFPPNGPEAAYLKQQLNYLRQ